MSILSKYYIDFGRLNQLYALYERIGDQGLVNKITDAVEWAKLDKGQKLLIFNTLRKLNVLLVYDTMQENASNSPNTFFYSAKNTDENVVTENDFEDAVPEDDYTDYDDYDGDGD